MSTEDNHAAGNLQIDGKCTECGAAFRAGIWDHSFSCEFCGSVLVSARELHQEVFVASNGREGSAGIVELLADREAERYRSELLGRMRLDEGLELGSPALVEGRVERRRQRALEEIEVEESVDFFVPYEIHEQTVAQGILGRKTEDAKETFVRSFDVEDISRLYDPSRFNLRDRGLKIFGFHLQLISDAHLQVAQNRFLEILPAEQRTPGQARDASKVKPKGELAIISMIDRTVRERRFRVYKHMTYARVRRGAKISAHLIDRQFGSIAGELAPEEIQRFRDLPARPAESVLKRPEIRAIASECPNCAWDLDLPPCERIVFCPTCATAIRVTAKGLETCSYRVGAAPDDADSLIYYPFWAHEFELMGAHRRVWDWLELCGPQKTAQQFRQNDPERGLLYIPARSLYGDPGLDDAFCQLAGWANWCQPTLYSDRPVPDSRATWTGVELDSDEAGALARFTLLAMHDVQSTRRLNGMNFARWIADAKLELGPAQLVALPLRIVEQRWLPELHEDFGQPERFRLVGSTIGGIGRADLLGNSARERLTKRFSLF